MKSREASDSMALCPKPTGSLWLERTIIVQGGHPAFMRIKRTDSTGNSYGHAIVPCAYYYNSDSSSLKYFSYMDPNYGQGTAVFPSSGTVAITTGGYTYNFDYYISTLW